MSSTAQSLESFCNPCKNFVPVDVSTPSHRFVLYSTPKPVPSAGRLVTVRRIGGLLLAAIVCLLTGKAPLQTFEQDPLDKVVTQDDDHVNETRSARYQKRDEVRSEKIAAPPTAPDDAFLDTTQRWDLRRLFRESDATSAAPAAAPAALPAGIAEFPAGLRCISEIAPPRRPGVQAEPPKIISQEDLTELEILGKRLREAKTRYAKKRDRVQSAIANGAKVEAGFRSVATVLVVR